MKKIICLLIVLISLAGCGQKQQASPETSTGRIANPMVEYESLQEINDIVGVKLAKPLIDGVTDEKFFVINNEIAEYDFKVKESEFTFRAAKDNGEDISGIYVDGKLVFEGFKDKHGSHFSEDARTFFFVAGDVRYNMSISGTISEDEIVDVIMYTEDQIYRLHADQELLDLLGEYQDSYSQRATMKINLFDDENVVISIVWSSSAEEYDEWGITATLNGDKLEYEGNYFIHAHYVGDDYELVNDSVDGYFEIKADGIYWTGSGNESTNKCQFVKYVD